MTIGEWMAHLYRWSDPEMERCPRTCDTLKAGDPQRELRRVAVSMFATVPVIRAAAEWGANLLIVHEPVFYDHWDALGDLENIPEPKRSQIKAKLALIDQCGMTIYRYHDHPHRRTPDTIAEGVTGFWGIAGSWSASPDYGVSNFTLKTPMPVRELAAALEKNLGLGCVRICGSTETLCRKLGLCFGTPGHVEEQLMLNDAVLTGEICEWMVGEFVRDCNDLFGRPCSVLVMGHIGSERDGMRLAAEQIRKLDPQREVRYFECGEIYHWER